ncbi:MAG: hypothetical protein R2912_02970 [Eubacteriales bacterium]
MALHKCPKCELNYIREEEVYCEVCKREMKRALARGVRMEEDEDEVVLCSECGEKPAARGGEFCHACLKERKRQVVLESAAALDDDDEYDEDSLLEEEDEDDSDEE